MELSVKQFERMVSGEIKPKKRVYFVMQQFTGQFKGDEVYSKCYTSFDECMEGFRTLKAIAEATVIFSIEKKIKYVEMWIYRFDWNEEGKCYLPHELMDLMKKRYSYAKIEY